MAAKSTYLRLLLIFGLIATAAACWLGYRIWPRSLNISPAPCLPEPSLEGSRWVVTTRAGVLLAEVADLRSELQAYLNFEYLRTHAGLASSQILLTAQQAGGRPHYRIYLFLNNDVLSAVPYLARLRAKGIISYFRLDPVPERDLAYRRLQTAVFLAAYNPISAPGLDSVDSARLLAPLARFLVFKSETDRRVREQIFPVPLSLSTAQATELAKDILAVTRFYDLPLAVFLGIGAMENNYMSARGDLGHAIWKPRPQRGDIVLKRRPGRYLVCNYSMGIWQITRETLRFAHRLYLHDKRDYAPLPPRLRPSQGLNFDLDNSEVLTTYAGLLLRNLLDQARGDIPRAVGAYNRNLRNPNLQYSAGVEAVASYARSFLARAANLDGMNVAESWLFPGEPGALEEKVETIQPAASASPAAAQPELGLLAGTE